MDEILNNLGTIVTIVVTICGFLLTCFRFIHSQLKDFREESRAGLARIDANVNKRLDEFAAEVNERLDKNELKTSEIEREHGQKLARLEGSTEFLQGCIKKQVDAVG